MNKTTRTHKDFEKFMSQLAETILSLKNYTDFNKCNANVSRIALKLNQLNYLIGQEDMEKAIRELWDENPKVFSVLDILIAVRTKSRKKVIDAENNVRLVSSYFESVEGVIEYIKKTGLEAVFKNKQVTNLVDYVFGIEVGMDSHGRKNRGGKEMENLVAEIFEKNGIAYVPQVDSKHIPAIRNVLGKDEKKFDFAVSVADKTYLVEVNYYSTGGSKLNETARSFIEVASKVNSCEGYEFVWITDGIGWKEAQSHLEEAFYTIPRLYNLTTIKDWIKEIAM